MHGRHGKITSINEHYGAAGTHASITVTHGKRKRSKVDGNLTDHDRHMSTVVIPKAQASSYKLGQKVHVGLQPSADMDDAGDSEDEGNESAQVAPEATSIPGKQSRIVDARSSKAKGRIASALSKKRK